MPHSQIAANHHHQEKEKNETDAQNNQIHVKRKNSSLFPKRDDQNAQTNAKMGQRAKHKNAPWYKQQSYLVPLKPVLGGVASLAHFITGHEQTE